MIRRFVFLGPECSMYIGNVKNRRDPNLDETAHAVINKTYISASFRRY